MRQHNILFASSYDRGLQNLLHMWPDILAKFEDAQLHIAYGWKTFDALTANNPERVQWKSVMTMLMNQKGITHHGRLSKDELNELTKSCGIWAYPTSFEEINCITALNCQSLGCVPVVTNYAALKETVGSGIKVDADIKTTEGRDEFVKALFEMMSNKELWEKESKKGVRFAKSYDWSKIASKWVDVFSEPVRDVKVSIITPTIRTGWWNLMASNLSHQTHKNFEWVIVDDYKEDRSEVAEKYAEMYNLNIKYIRGDKALGTYHRPCGLVRANNIGWKQSSGELLVWLQDFIVLDPEAIERLVSLYRHNKDSIIAPVDEYYNAIEADKSNKEDWWNGKTDIATNKSWSNPRCKNKGIYRTDNPYDYEANYGAIPRHILDACNGFWEVLDYGLGYDNTIIAYTALKLGYKVLIDDTNIAMCVNIWPVVGGTGENVLNRERMANPPRYKWLTEQIDKGNIPLVRDQKIDDKLELEFELPKDVTEKDMSAWIAEHTDEIAKSWKDYEREKPSSAQ